MTGLKRKNNATSGSAKRRRTQSAESPMEEPVRTVCLKRYLIQAWQEMVDPNVEKHLPTSIFARKITENDKPFLRSDQTNHIITYTGAFNPPHSGHIEILADGFNNSGPGLNIVSSFVVPLGDGGLQAKEDARKGAEPTPRQVMLARTQRAELVMAHLRETEALRELACKTKVWSFPELEPIPGYMRRVTELAAADGFDVEYVSLKGPDHLWYDRPINHPALILCNKIIFSEVSRANEDTWVRGRPRRLRGGWSRWSEISNVTGDDGVTRSVWECTLKTPAGSAVRLLTDDNEADKPDISSTRIRKVILESAPGEDLKALVQKLRDAYVISPETLVQFLGAQ
ncbi:hypothetical protein INS49_004342 [Diaporthe citri]|uniref:uncharacterized protein n=1 Tax=Diaporthe citri TaxID=83186 RepID=UPI001C8274F1|nr:uncharacterized protein INS49_004342 [Diaporthe citri]KAG6355260.1 hypothetical protein INS49_004342 [Diaporthe citri]